MRSREEQIISEIVSAYDHPIVRAYCRIRFQILNQRFLDEIGQYLPKRGKVLDIGCGFGLFSLYYARLRPQLQIIGIDRNKERVERARLAAERLGITNVRYEVGDVTEYAFLSQFDGAYMLDIVHHVPRNEVHALLERVSYSLSPGARLIVKDIDTKPAYKRWFTYVLDKLMDYKTPVHYWPRQELASLLENLGFEVFQHTIKDYLPYPHLMYICRDQRSVTAAVPTAVYRVAKGLV